MGHITAFNIQEIIDKYGCTYFFEICTDNELVDWGHVYSYKIDKETHTLAKANFLNYGRIKIDSLKILEDTLFKISFHDPILFCINLYFSYPTEGLNSYGGLKNLRILSVIKKYRPYNKDIIILNDLKNKLFSYNCAHKSIL